MAARAKKLKPFNVDLIRDFIAARRLALELTQGELAEAIGMSEKHGAALIHRIENGKRKISIEEYVKICEALLIEPHIPIWRGPELVTAISDAAHRQVSELRAENKALKQLIVDMKKRKDYAEA